MPAYTDTTAYPVFATKKALLRELMRLAEANCPNAMDLAFRINNSTSALSDMATVYKPAGLFNS
jgi:hypothetical protein